MPDTSFKWPTVTAILNTHPEACAMLPRALDSILAQDYNDFELIVVCDGQPSDDILNVIDEYSPKFEARGVEGRFVATSERYGAQAGPKNHATYIAKGDYIAYLDVDNEWSHDHLSVLMRPFKEGETWPDIVYGRREYVRDEGAPEKVGDVPLSEGVSPFVPWDDLARARLSDERYGPLANFIDTSDFVVSRGALWWKSSVTGWMWNEKWRRFGDWILVVEGVLFTGWKPYAVDRVVSRYHWHANNICHTRPAHEGVAMARVK